MTVLPKIFSAALLAAVLAGQNVRTLSEQAAQARRLGQTAVEFVPVLIAPTPDEDLSTLAKTYSFVVATPISSLVVERRGRLDTWIKFRTQEVIKLQSSIGDNSNSDTYVPASLLPVLRTEFLVCLPGGSLVVDGVTFHEAPPYPLTLHQTSTYFLILYFEDAKRALLADKDRGVFLVDSQGRLAPVKSGGSRVQKDVASSYSNSLSLVRDAIRKFAEK